MRKIGQIEKGFLLRSSQNVIERWNKFSDNYFAFDFLLAVADGQIPRQHSVSASKMV